MGDIQMIYKWHTGDIRVYADNIRAHTNDILVTYDWHTNTYEMVKQYKGFGSLIS